MEYKLVFEGPADVSIETLTKIKGVLIADLELSIEEVKHILESAPLTIKRAETEGELIVHFKALKNAGGKVLLVKEGGAPGEEEQAEQQEAAAIEFDDTLLDQMSGSDESADDEAPEAAEMMVEDQTVNEVLSAANSAGHDEIPVLDLSLDAPAAAEEPPKSGPGAAHGGEPEGNGPVFELEPLDAPPPAAKEKPAKSDSPKVYDLSLAFEEQSEEAAAEQPAAGMSKEKEQPAGGPALQLHDNAAELPKPQVVPPATPKKQGPPAEKKAAASGGGLDFNLTLAEEEAPSAAPLIEAVEGEAPDSEFDLSLTPDVSPAAVEQPGPATEAGATQPPAQESVTPPTPRAGQALQESGAKAGAAAPQGDRPLAELQAKLQMPKHEAAEDGDEEAAAGEETEEPPAQPAKRGFLKDSPIPFDLLVPIIAGTAVLLIANWLFFSAAPEEDPLSDMQQVLQQEQQQTQKSEPPPPVVQPEQAQEPPAPEIKLLSGAAGVQLTGSLTAEAEGKSLTASLTFTTPMPPELTPEQIVQNVLRPPWVESIELRHLQLPLTPEGEFAIEDLAKTYINDWTDHQRVVTKVNLKGHFDAASGAVKATVVFNREFNEPSPAPFVVERLPGGGYRLFMEAVFEGRVLKAKTKDQTAGAAAPAGDAPKTGTD